MDQTPDLGRWLAVRLRDERLRLFKKSSVLVRRVERSPYSQNAVGRRVGICGDTVSKWEQGVAKPSLDQWDRWCAALDLDFIELLTEAKEWKRS